MTETPYEAPMLAPIGSIEELTLGGPGIGADASMNQPPESGPN
ncbi:MAG: lasso RiPP family leader peptide-containing protein [Solirubrobacterales bacterium]